MMNSTQQMLLADEATVLRQFNQSIKKATRTVKSSEDFLQWFRDNWTLLYQRGFYQYHRRWNLKVKKSPPTLQLKSVTWKPYWGFQHNTHSCPRGGVTNWGQKVELPKGYQGWCGYMEWDYTGKDFNGAGSDMFAGTVIHTGSGGGGGTGYGYDVLLWSDDWPAWKLAEEQALTWQVLVS